MNQDIKNFSTSHSNVYSSHIQAASESEQPLFEVSPHSHAHIKYNKLEATSFFSQNPENEAKSCNLQSKEQGLKDSNLLSITSHIPQGNTKVPGQELEPASSFLFLKMSDRSLNYSFDMQGEEKETKSEEIKPSLTKKLRLFPKRNEETSRKGSSDLSKSEPKEPKSAELRQNKEENGTSFLSDIVISQKKHANEVKKSNFVRRNLLPAKPVTISLTFDAFLDQVKGHETNSIASTYPSYKIDKRLIFLGKEVDYPWHIISYHSTFRKIWNLFIIGIISYQTFWYPTVAAFAYGDPWPMSTLIFEIISIAIFLMDIIINIRTTYSNENNEEIIDGKMIGKNYISALLFKIDVITTLPIPEILLLVLNGYSIRWTAYSLIILIRMLRVCKISTYLHNRTMSTFFKLLRIFAVFFMIVHWVSCIWYVAIRIEFPDIPSIDSLWFPNNLRMIATGDEDLLAYYDGMDKIKVYGFTLLSVFMLVVGSDMAPMTNLQIWMSVIIGLFGAVSLAYIFGLVTLTINRANEKSVLYQQQHEELKNKLKINKIPHNLRIKVMEYFDYSWRKHSVLKKMDDFSELSIPLQRDIALYQHQEMILKVPLFKELDPVEILRIVQKLKTAIYMPGDKIIREGERGTEMFFVQEGIAEMLIKKPLLGNQKAKVGDKPHYEKIFLGKGSYFGEVALMSNSKRTFDVNAFEFCILYSFSRSDYESLKNEFRDIGPRLRSGLKHYKKTHMEQLIQILKNLDIFQNFTDKELRRIGDEYLEEMFVDPDKVVLAPKDRTNAIYVILAGNVHCYTNNNETRNYINQLKISNDNNNWTIVDVDEDKEIDCLDDDILNLEKDKISMDDQKKRLNLVRTYTYGEYFGTLDFDVNEIKCNKYYLTDSGCQIGAITQSLKSQMAIEDPELHDKLRNNVIKCCPRRVMMPIEEESESSFTTKNNTVIKLKAGGRPSFSDDGKKPYLIKATSLNQNKDDDIAAIKGEIQQLEDEMVRFKNLVSGINARLSSVLTGVHPTAVSSEAPSAKNKGRSSTFIQNMNLVKTAKTNSNKDISKLLMDIQENQGQEGQEEN